jgi:hypothetical protein
MTRVRPLVLLALAAVLATTAGACGGREEAATPASDVEELLSQTFSRDKEIESARLDLSLRIDGRDAAVHGLSGPVVLRLAGPFESEGQGRLPRFALDAEVTSGGIGFTAGATSTGDAGYVAFQGEDYAVAGPVFEQFKAGYEQAHKQGSGQRGHSFASLGMDPRRWLVDARNAGEAKVGDADTIKITGGVDVQALLDDIDTALGQARSLGLAGRLPERIAPAQRQKAERAVRDVDVAIYTGKDDRILRRLRVGLDLAGERGGRAAVVLDVSLTGVDEDQDIAAPSDPRPFGELTDRLGGLGFALGGGGGAMPGAGAPGRGALKRFSDCIADAGGDAAAARECSALLTP